MSITFYTTRQASPATRTVQTVIRILNLDVKTRDINVLENENFQPWFAKLNPARVVPVLDDNGYILTESRAIASYLLTVHAPKDILEQYYPTDPKQRGIINSRWDFDNGTLFARMKTIVAPLVLRGVKDIPMEETQSLAEAVDSLENLLEGREWLAANRLTVADISTVMTIDLVDFLIPLKHYKNVTAWANRVRRVCPFYEELGRELLDNFAVQFNRTTYDANDRWNNIRSIVKN